MFAYISGALIVLYAGGYYVKRLLRNSPPNVSVLFTLAWKIYRYFAIPKFTKYQVFSYISKFYGSLYSCYGDGDGEKCVIVNGGDLVNEVFKAGDVFASRSPNFSLQIVSDSYHDALNIIYMKHWKMLRKIGRTALSTHIMKSNTFDVILIDECQYLVARLSQEAGKFTDPTRNLMLTIINITSRLVFNKRFEISDYYFGQIENVLNQNFNKSTPHDHTSNTSKNFFESLINEVKERDEGTKECRKNSSVAQTISCEVKEMLEKLSVSDTQIEQYFAFTIIFEVFFSSLEPILATIAWFILLKTRSQETDATKLDSEIRNVDITIPDNVMKLNYSKAFLNEVLRFGCVVPLYPRKAERDTLLGGYDIPKDTTLFLNIYSLHYDSTIWHSPKNFDPTRWLDKNDKFCTINSKYFAPFGGGMRRCFGEIMAKREVLYILVVLLKNFEIVEDETEPNCLSPNDGTFNIPSKLKVLFSLKK